LTSDVSLKNVPLESNNIVSNESNTIIVFYIVIVRRK